MVHLFYVKSRTDDIRHINRDITLVLVLLIKFLRNLTHESSKLTLKLYCD